MDWEAGLPDGAGSAALDQIFRRQLSELRKSLEGRKSYSELLSRRDCTAINTYTLKKKPQKIQYNYTENPTTSYKTQTRFNFNRQQKVKMHLTRF